MNQRAAASEITTHTPALGAPDLNGPIVDAIGEVMHAAATYADTAGRFAEVRDIRGLGYSVRSCAACLSHAAELLEELTKAATLKSGGRRQ